MWISACVKYSREAMLALASGIVVVAFIALSLGCVLLRKQRIRVPVNTIDNAVYQRLADTAMKRSSARRSPDLERIARTVRKYCPMHLAKQAQMCSLCNKQIEEFDSIRALPCSHCFHNMCILRWLILSQLRCPDCNETIPLLGA